MQKLWSRVKMGKEGPLARNLPLGDDGVCQITVVGTRGTAHAILAYLALLDENTPIRIHVFNTCGRERAERLAAVMMDSKGIVLHHVCDQDRDLFHQAFSGNSILPGKLGIPSKISGDAADVIPGSQLVLLAMNTDEDTEVLERIKPHLLEDAWVGHFASRGFEDLVLKQGLGDGFKGTIFGLSDCPWISEVEELGRSVKILGTLRRVGVSCYPNKNLNAVAKVCQGIIDPAAELCYVDSSYSFLGSTFAANAFTTCFLNAADRNWNKFDHKEDCGTLSNFIDYQACSALMESSGEIQMVAKTLADRYPKLDLSGAKHLVDWWSDKFEKQVRDPASLERELKSSNTSFKHLKVKAIKKSSGSEIDYSEGFLEEEVANSLLPVKGIASFLGLHTPKLDCLIVWAQEKLGKEYIKPSNAPLGGLDPVQQKVHGLSLQDRPGEAMSRAEDAEASVSKHASVLGSGGEKGIRQQPQLATVGKDQGRSIPVKSGGVASAASPTHRMSPVEERESLSSQKGRHYDCIGRDIKNTRAPQSWGCHSVEDFLALHYMPIEDVA